MKDEMISDKGFFAVLDSETTWHHAVMSIGVVIADCNTFQPIDKKYYIITPACDEGGMFSGALIHKKAKITYKNNRKNVIDNLIEVLHGYNVNTILAYNASFDYNHLQELHTFAWRDIMGIAAYKQYNPLISEFDDCCRTGRLKTDYGVEPMMRLLSGKNSYREIHNALCDAIDELKIIELLKRRIEDYPIVQAKQRGDHSSTPKKKKKTGKEIFPECKYTVGTRIQHTEYGVGIVERVIIVKSGVSMMNVRYEDFGIQRHWLPNEDKDITILND